MMQCLLLIGALLAGQATTPSAEDLKADVGRLVRQLDAPQLAWRDAAEAELLSRGPGILELLPPASNSASAEVQQRLGRIRQRLQQAAAESATRSSTITLQADNLPLSKILTAFQQQSGNTIVDYRQQFGQPATDPKLTVTFNKTPFWPALDRLLDQAGLTVYPYAQQRALGVVAVSGDKKIERTGRASYSGPFRIEPVLVIARRDLREASGGSLIVTLEATWEPRLRIISLIERMADVQALDERGEPLPLSDRAAQPELPLGSEAPAVKLELPLRLPPRDVRRIASLKGKLLATVPGKIETFRFDKLAEGKKLEQRIAGVTVTLEHVHKAATGGRAAEMVLEVRVRFDDAGDALASHRQWIFSNPAYLEGPDGKPIAYDTFDTTAQGKNELGLVYHFRVERPLEELTFVYKTPGTIVTDSFDYQLKDIVLP
jgi:hypothetical protein